VSRGLDHGNGGDASSGGSNAHSRRDVSPVPAAHPSGITFTEYSGLD
jgi:hypothetical protein